MKKVITYETPELTVYEMHSEGALCGSLDSFGADNLKEGESNWFEEEE